MTEPTQEEIDAALDWVVWVRDQLPGLSSRPELCAAYANHVTAELQAKITKLEDDTTVLCTSVLRYRDRIATLEAALAARDFVPIGDEHKDGQPWQVGAWMGNTFVQTNARWSTAVQRWLGAYAIEPTHAAPLPQPPKEGE